MQKKSTVSSGFFSSRALIAFFVSVAACSIVTGTLPLFVHPKALSNASQRTLTFEERVSYQRAIEDVYWRHRSWPKERPDSKPSLDAVMSQAQLEKKVADYLRNSQALEDYWQRPITAEQLQAEMDRMAQHTKQPEVLQELFEALGNDPFTIAECLARPAVAKRLLTSSYPSSQTFSGGLKEHAKTDLLVNQTVLAWNTETLESSPRGTKYELPITIATPVGPYMLPKTFDGVTCNDDTWILTATANAPDARGGHTAVWTGSEMIVWGGYDNNFVLLNSGGRYNPATDSWIATSLSNAPLPRDGHSAIWNGSEMILWGGNDNGSWNTGGRYNPAMDTWTATSTTNAPTGRSNHTAVWTGSEMIVWGGVNVMGFVLNTGGRYNPNSDSWSATSTANAPDARTLHTAIWSADEMIVWGGWDAGSTFFTTGGRYNVNTDSWTNTSTTNAPVGRVNHTAVWTGNQMIVWGGNDHNGTFMNTGGRYAPGTDSWTPTSIMNPPDGRYGHTALWTGSEMIVWGGFASLPSNTGGRYTPGTNTWAITNVAGAPDARAFHTAVWASGQMIVWGGVGLVAELNTGGRYCAQSGPPSTPTPTPRVTPRPRPTPHPRPTPP
jgi:hypothetical protein